MATAIRPADGGVFQTIVCLGFYFFWAFFFSSSSFMAGAPEGAHGLGGSIRRWCPRDLYRTSGGDSSHLLVPLVPRILLAVQCCGSGTAPQPRVTRAPEQVLLFPWR